MRILNITAIAVCLVLMMATIGRAESFAGAVHFTDGEVVQAKVVLAMKAEDLKARFITHDAGMVMFDEIGTIDFSGETDFRGGFKFLVTHRNGERIPGWIRMGEDFGYMWEVTTEGQDKGKAYKLNQGVKAERNKEVLKIVFE